MLLRKPGVTFILAPAGMRILEGLKLISTMMKIDFTITSGSDGAHSGPADPHHTGEAYDIRSHDLSPAKKTELVSLLRQVLGPRFYAFLESPHTENEHIHIQRTRNTTYSLDDYLKSR